MYQKLKEPKEKNIFKKNKQNGYNLFLEAVYQ